MPPKLVTAASVEPITTTEAKTHVRQDTADDDTYIDTLIGAARQRVETLTYRQVNTATWKLLLDVFPCDSFIELPFSPLASVTHVKYYDTDGNQQTWDSSNYQVDTASEPGRVVLGIGASWPSTQADKLQAVEIQYVAGYGDAAAVPLGLKHCVKLLVGHWYENREGITMDGTPKEVPEGIKKLAWQYRVPEIR